ncbi:MAG: glycosyltransferase family 4 protein [Bacteroidetes bacterium]|nr:glycosyltransferase family 4 protein [Bacteroidota bacterium]
MTRVCHITTVHGAFDDRIFFKQCRSLAAAGFDVHLIAPIDRAVTEDGVHMHPVRVPASRILRPIVGAWRAFREARKLKAAVYQVHDPELLWIALLLKRGGAKVVYDMHESMRGHILTKTWLGPAWLRKLASRLYGWFEDLAIRKLDRVLVVVDSMREDIVRLHPAQTRKVEVIRNLPVLAIIDRSLKTVGRDERFTLIYVGGLSRIRGIKEVVMALEALPDVRLKLLGPWADETYRAECAALPAWAQVDDLGQVRMDEVYDHVRATDLGVCLLYPVHNYMISLPIKTFEYMACGLPMLVSDFPFWRQTFGPFGWFADAQAPATIATAVRAAQANAEGRRTKGLEGRREVEQHYSWESESKRLVDLYRQLER